MRNTWAFISLTLLLAAGGCRKSPTPTPTVLPESGATGELRAVKAVVEYREREQDPLKEVAPSTTVSVAAAGNIVIGPTGRAELSWTQFVETELLSGTDMLVSLAEPSERSLMLDQAAGTSRYKLLGGGPSEITIEAGWIEVSIASGPADVIVSFVPGPPSTVWLTAVRGSATVALAGEEGEEPVPVAEGESVGVPEGGPMPQPMAIDIAEVETWYSSVAAGTATTSIVPVAMVCRPTSSQPLREDASDSAAQTDVTLETTDDARVIGLDGTGEWARIRVVKGLRGAGTATSPSSTTPSEPGWVSASALVCNAPIAAARAARQEATPAQATASPSVAPVPGRTVIVVSVTPPPVTPTQTRTATPVVGDAVIEFWADDDEIELGECTDVHWRTANIDSVWYQGQGVAGEGLREECPTTKTTYTLRVKKKDGTEETRTVTVDVEVPEGPGPGPSATPIPAPATEEPTDEPTEMPTAVGTTVAPSSRF